MAGPDIYTNEYGLKPAFDIDGEPLLVKAIHSRHWYGKSLFEKDLIFVIRNFEKLSELQNLLQSNFPKGKQVIIPELTKGALMSSLVGVSLIKDFSEPIVIDLVDILFNSKLDHQDILNNNKDTDGIIPFFISQNPKYSYLELDNELNVLKTIEKKIISKYASAGVYFFRNLTPFLDSVNYSINNLSQITYENLLYLCPAFNGIISTGKNVKAVKVEVVNEISLIF